MKNKLKYTALTIAVFAIIVAILLHNRAQIKAESKNETIDAYPVNVSTVVSKELTHQVNLVGTITANNDVPIVSEAEGKVTKVFANVGDYKAAGAVLVQLDDELKNAAFKTAEANFEKAKKDYERFQALTKENSATDSQLEGIKLAYQTAESQFITARRQYNDTKVSTPISGFVSSRTADVGDYVYSKTVVAEVVDISKLKITLNVDENDVFKMKEGNDVEITTNIYPGVIFQGKIKTISDKGDAAHTYPVEVDFLNSKEHPLKAGMFANVEFNSGVDKKSLAIPREALVGSVKEPKVFVVKDGTAKLTEIIVGAGYNNYLEVLKGLDEGETVVVNGQNNLKDGYKVTIVE